MKKGVASRAALFCCFSYIRYWSTDKGLTITDPNGNLIWELTVGRNPQWSRSGDRILFCDNNGTGVWNLFVIEADGTGNTQLTNYNESVVPSPDNSRGESVWFYDDRYVLYRLMNDNQTIIKDLDNGSEYNYSEMGFPIWLENYHLATLTGNSSRELVISSVDGSFEEIIVILPDSLSNPSELHYISN